MGWMWIEVITLFYDEWGRTGGGAVNVGGHGRIESTVLDTAVHQMQLLAASLIGNFDAISETVVKRSIIV